MRLIDRLRPEADRLEIPFGAGGLEPQPLELTGNVFRRLAMASTASVTAFELVVGQDPHVRPPSLAVGPIRPPRSHGRHERNPHHPRPYTPLSSTGSAPR